MKKLLILTVFCLLFSSCADNTPVQECLTQGHVYGFWGGLWHGIIAPFDFIGMLIWDDVTVYAQNNNGGWYALGAFSGTITSKK